MKADDLFAQLTNELIRDIEAGADDWSMPWRKLNRTPKSADGRPYRGINWWVLGVIAESRGWTSHQWATYRQWESHGFQVQKGEKASHAILWKQAEHSKARQAEHILATGTALKPYLLARAFAVFAREQTDAPPLETPELTEHERHQAAHDFFANIGADVREGGDRAFYAPAGDYIQVPLIGQFPVRDHFYSTLAHEHTHWTGHESRLNRDITNRFGDEAYAMEELVAELGAAFIGAQLGLDQAVRKDHASYLKHWLSVLKSDPKALVTVTSKAQAATDHLNELAAVKPELQEAV